LQTGFFLYDKGRDYLNQFAVGGITKDVGAAKLIRPLPRDHSGFTCAL